MPEPQRLPLSTDLALHAAPAISLIIDFYLLERKYPKSVSRYGSFVLAAIVGTWYACWVEYCASYNGFCASLSPLSRVQLIHMTICSPVSVPHAESVQRPGGNLRRCKFLRGARLHSHQRTSSVNEELSFGHIL